MNLSDDWRSHFPVSSVFAPPSLLRTSPPAPHGPLLFSSVAPAVPLLSIPFLPPPPPSTAHGLYLCLRAFLGSNSLPASVLDSLSAPLLSTPSPPFPSRSNLLATLRVGSSSSLFLFFPYGDNADQIAFVSLASLTGSPVVLPFVQRDGFKHPKHRIQQLAATTTCSSWLSQLGDNLVEGFLLAATLYSVNWFRVESLVSGSLALVPAAKQGFDAAIVHTCWSKHFSSECVVLLENGELCWFDLNSRRGGKIKVTLGNKDDWGEWLSCEYGAQPWTVIIASSKTVFLVDLRLEERGECKVIAKVGMTGLFETEPLVVSDRHLAFCKSRFDDFQISVVTERHLMLFNVQQPLTPVLTWEHGLESPNHVAMFQLAELRPSKEYEWASNSGFAILVGSFWNAEFRLFCYGPKEQGCPSNSRLYAWDLPSHLSLTGQCCSSSNGIMKEVFSSANSAYDSANSIIGYCILPNNLTLLEPTFTGFALIRLMASGKLEMQKYHTSVDMFDEISCDEPQHTTGFISSSIVLDTAEEKYTARYKFLKLHFLYEHMKGNLCNALGKHDSNVSKEMGPIIISKDMSDFAKDNCSSFSPSVSDFLSDASIPMNIFEIACRSILSGLPSDLLSVTFLKYKDMLACSTEKAVFEHLEVPSCLPHNKLRPFLLSKPSSTSEKLSSKILCGDTLVGPVLPVHVLLAMKERNKGTESPSQGETADTNLVSHHCREVLEALLPEISIADTGNWNGWSASQEMNDEKSFFIYESQIKSRLALDETTRKKENEQQNLADDPTMPQTSAVPYQDENFMTFVCGKARSPDSGPELAASDLFNLSPLVLAFDSPSVDVQPAEEKIYKCLKKQFLIWQNNFKPYQDFCSSNKIPKPIQ